MKQLPLKDTYCTIAHLRSWASARDIPVPLCTVVSFSLLCNPLLDPCRELIWAQHFSFDQNCLNCWFCKAQCALLAQYMKKEMMHKMWALIWCQMILIMNEFSREKTAREMSSKLRKEKGNGVLIYHQSCAPLQSLKPISSPYFSKQASCSSPKRLNLFLSLTRSSVMAGAEETWSYWKLVHYYHPITHISSLFYLSVKKWNRE